MPSTTRDGFLASAFHLKSYRPTFLRMVMERSPNGLPMSSRVRGQYSPEMTQTQYDPMQAAITAEAVRSLLDHHAIVPRTCHTRD